MDISEIIKATNGIFLNTIKKTKINSIKLDSKKIEKDDAFLAINTGHNYIEEAIEKGASLIIVDRDIEKNKKVNIIKVEDSIKALQLLANYLRRKYDPIVIGITGSVGKTTTKEMIYQILSKNFNVIKNEGNENNHIGVPKTLLRLTENTDILIVEMGMNHKDEIHELSLIAEPDIAIITNVGTSHIGNLGSKKEIFKEKLKIIDGMKNGILILNNDDSYLRKINPLDIYLCKVGIKKDSDLVAYDLKYIDKKVSSNIYIDNIKYELKSISKSYLINSLLALEVGFIFELEIEEMLDILNNFKTEDNRLEEINIDSTTIISDCYNASLESFYNALEIIKEDKRRKILILGDILELGKHSKKIHKKIGKKIRAIKNCELILVGENVKYIKKYNQTKSIWCKNNEEIKECLSILDLNNKVILIKGSHGMHLDEITNYLKEYK